jgi:hypothetical protein
MGSPQAPRCAYRGWRGAAALCGRREWRLRANGFKWGGLLNAIEAQSIDPQAFAATWSEIADLIAIPRAYFINGKLKYSSSEFPQ